ncbi:hypothetical protein [Enterococcus sp. DIV0212c]|uniref:hypothetical protein n=1 Tax=Enterococcus sp. DIV0212c TaxID=2230867 RepID=UPI001AC64D7A|nr:hypothetical protein [Enterococcus sp. DIV0212c]
MIYEKRIAEQKKKYQISFAILSLLLLILTGYFFLTQEKEQLLGSESHATPHKSKIKKPEAWSNEKIAFPAFKQVTIKEGTENLYIALTNPSFNSAKIKFTVYLDQQKEALLKTGLIKPGEAVTEVPLPKGLSLGTHNVFLKMQGYASEDEEAVLSGTDTSFKLIVLKE